MYVYNIYIIRVRSRITVTKVHIYYPVGVYECTMIKKNSSDFRDIYTYIYIKHIMRVGVLIYRHLTCVKLP